LIIITAVEQANTPKTRTSTRKSTHELPVYASGINHSPFAIHHSAFGIRHLAFGIRHSWHSSFGIWHSAFGIWHRWAFPALSIEH
jgi:hypothetical protein